MLQNHKSASCLGYSPVHHASCVTQSFRSRRKEYSACVKKKRNHQSLDGQKRLCIKGNIPINNRQLFLSWHLSLSREDSLKHTLGLGTLHFEYQMSIEFHYQVATVSTVSQIPKRRTLTLLHSSCWQKEGRQT